MILHLDNTLQFKTLFSQKFHDYCCNSSLKCQCLIIIAVSFCFVGSKLLLVTVINDTFQMKLVPRTTQIVL